MLSVYNSDFFSTTKVPKGEGKMKENETYRGWGVGGGGGGGGKPAKVKAIVKFKYPQITILKASSLS